MENHLCILYYWQRIDKSKWFSKLIYLLSDRPTVYPSGQSDRRWISDANQVETGRNVIGIGVRISSIS